MNTTWSRFNVTSIVLGFAFLYLPIVLLIVFSFNESKLVTVWGGFSTKWYVSLYHNQGLMDAAWVTARVGVISATVATVLGTLAALTLTRYTRFRGRLLFSGMVFAPLVMPEVITGLSLLLLFVAVGLDRGFLTVTLAHNLDHVLRRSRRAVTPGQLRPLAGRSRDGSRRNAGEDLLPDHAAGHHAGDRVRLDAGLHAFAR